MRKSLILLIILLLVTPVSVSANSASKQGEQSSVHAVLFWSGGCPYCEQVLTGILPTMQNKYQSQLSILLIELVTTKDVDNLYALGAVLGLSKEQISIPFLLIGQKALVGVEAINNKMADLIDQFLDSGGVDYPNIQRLREMLPQGIEFNSFEANLQLVSKSATGSNSLGIASAWVVMALMGFTLIFTILMILRAFQGKHLPESSGWMNIFIPLLSIIGLGASIYLTYVEITHTRALCGPLGDCNAVQSSPYAKLFGVLPVGLLGAIGYIAILASWLWQRFRADSIAKSAGLIMFGMALFGTLFSIYLTYLELFVIHAVCIWCLSSAVIITALLLLNLPALTQWLAISDDEE